MLSARALSFFIALILPLVSHANLISRDSVYGAGSITFDTDTYSEWIDPWISIIPLNGSICCNNYDDVVAQLAGGGKFEGFRFATRTEVETLLFSSAGISALTAGSVDTATTQDVAAISNLMGFTDTTFGSGFTRILDARFYDDLVGQTGRTILSHTAIGSSSFGSYRFSADFFPSNRSDPVGNWLIRVDEPGSASLLMAALLGLVLRRFRKPL